MEGNQEIHTIDSKDRTFAAAVATGTAQAVSEDELTQIRETVHEEARLLGKDPPDFSPALP